MHGKRILILYCGVMLAHGHHSSLFANFTNRYDTLTTLDGKEYTKAKPQRIENEALIIFHSKGISKIPIRKLPDNILIDIGRPTNAELRAKEQEDYKIRKARQDWERQHQLEQDRERRIAAMDDVNALKRAAKERKKSGISDISWQEVDKIYNMKSKNTDLQKDEAWKQYKGKKVEWTGKVTSVGDSWGSTMLQVKMNPDTWTSDVIITLKKAEKPKALKLKEKDKVTFRGVLTRWGTLMPISIQDGEIIH